MTDFGYVFKNKNFLVVGLGCSGMATLKELDKLGCKIAVQDSRDRSNVSKEILDWLDEKGVITYFGEVPSDMSRFNTLVLSPGVSPELDFIKKAKESGAEVIGELELAYRLSNGIYIAITGTNGKTTTTTLVGEIFKGASREVSVVGNIGLPVISQISGKSDNHFFVCEVSSFQLETVEEFRPKVSAILNLTPDHLNRHHTFENYGEAKARIFAKQLENDYLVLNEDDENAFDLAKRYNCKAKIVPFSRKKILDFGVYVDDGKIIIKDDKEQRVQVCPIEDIKIIGAHNLENVLAATAISYFAGIEVSTIAETISKFGGVEHRLEYCGNIDGVKYYNDSKGTNIDATVTAINAIKENIILIAGGEGKGQDFKVLVEKFENKVKTLIVLGKDGKAISNTAKSAGFKSILSVNDMEQAVMTANRIATSGDSVLLSPACASWDMYDNFEQRGDHFKGCVDRLESR